MLRPRFTARLSPTFERSFFTTRQGIPARPNRFGYRADSVRHYLTFPHNADSWIRDVRSKKILVWTCIGINAVVWLGWTSARVGFDPSSDFSPSVKEKARTAFRILRENFTLSSQNLREGRWWTTVTSAFSQLQIWHFAFNMLAFQQLSQILVYTPGLKAGKHLGVLILGSILSGSAAFLSHESTTSPGVNRTGLGFSAAVSGLVTSVACLAPYQRVLLFGVLPMPLWVLGLGYIVYDSYMLEGDSSVAHDAHIGGAIFGGAFYVLVLKRFGGILGRRR